MASPSLLASRGAVFPAAPRHRKIADVISKEKAQTSAGTAIADASSARKAFSSAVSLSCTLHAHPCVRQVRMRIPPLTRCGIKQFLRFLPK